MVQALLIIAHCLTVNDQHVDPPASFHLLTFMFMVWPPLCGARFSQALLISILTAFTWAFLTFTVLWANDVIPVYEALWRLYVIAFSTLLSLCLSYTLEYSMRSNFFQMRTLSQANIRAQMQLNPFQVASLKGWLEGPEEPQAGVVTKLGKQRSAPSPSISFNQTVKENPGLLRWLIPYQELVLGTKVAAGGSGVVYRGEYANQQVAIKQLYTTMMNANDLAEFSNEVSLLSSLANCPNIIRMLGISKLPAGLALASEGGEAKANADNLDTSLFVVMEWCERNLTDIMQSSEWPDFSQQLDEAALRHGTEKVVTVALQICTAMAFLHSNQITHNDLKPANVLMQVTGLLNYMDCFFFHVLDARLRRTMLAEAISLRYAALGCVNRITPITWGCITRINQFRCATSG